MSALMWTVGLCWMIPMMSAMMACALVVSPDRTEWLSRLYCWGQVRAAGARWRAEVHPDVDPAVAYVFASNHVNLLDHVTMYNSTPHFKQGVELASHFKIPVYGWFMRQRGTIPVDKAPGARERLREAVRAEVARGHSLLVFPEGTRTRDGRVGPFKQGFFRIARDLGLAVVPVSVTGMQHVLPPGTATFRPAGEVVVRCGKPVPLAGLDDERLDEAIASIRAEIAGHVDRHLGVADG